MHDFDPDADMKKGDTIDFFNLGIVPRGKALTDENCGEKEAVSVPEKATR